jgi:sigma-E factor negative regulatory protein RseC
MNNDLLQGTVTAVHEGTLTARINDEDRCEGCGARKSCGMAAGANEKQIEIPYLSGQYKEGDRINLLVKSSMGVKAAFFAFILPLILALTVLFTASFAGKGEKFMALTALLAISIYYTSLYFFRDKLKQKFTFIIQ